MVGEVVWEGAAGDGAGVEECYEALGGLGREAVAGGEGGGGEVGYGKEDGEFDEGYCEGCG